DVPGLLEVAASLEPAGAAFFWQGLVFMLLASLVVAVRCSGAVSGERQRQTWGAPLLPPPSTRPLGGSKVRGGRRAASPYLLAHAVPALALAVPAGPAALAWAAVWFVLTCLAMCFTGAVGLWCSVRARGSWRSLLGTLAFAYAGGFLISA